MKGDSNAKIYKKNLACQKLNIFRYLFSSLILFIVFSMFVVPITEAATSYSGSGPCSLCSDPTHCVWNGNPVSCANEYVCFKNPITGPGCYQLKCQTYNDCPQGSVCSANNFCTQQSCQTNAQCPFGTICSGTLCVGATLSESCISNSECATNQMCTRDLASGKSSCLTWSCSQDVDCDPTICSGGKNCPVESPDYSCITGQCQRTKQCQTSEDCGGQSTALIVSVASQSALATFCDQSKNLCVPDLSCTQDSDCGSNNGSPNICYSSSTGNKCVAWDNAVCSTDQDCSAKFGSDSLCVLGTSGDKFCRQKVGYGGACYGFDALCKEGTCDPVKKICAKGTANWLGFPNCASTSECLSGLYCKKVISNWKTCQQARCSITADCTRLLEDSNALCVGATDSSRGVCKVKNKELGEVCTVNEECKEGGCNPTSHVCSLILGSLCTNGATCDDGQKCVDGTNGKGLCPTTLGQWCGQPGLTCKPNPPAPTGPGLNLQFKRLSTAATCGTDNICGGNGATCSQFSRNRCVSPGICILGRCGIITLVQVIPDCPTDNACSTEGAKECSGTGARTCNKVNGQNGVKCLVWSSVTTCGNGQTCNIATGQCAAPPSSCTLKEDCGSNQVCIAGVCVANPITVTPQSCTKDSDCKNRTVSGQSVGGYPLDYCKITGSTGTCTELSNNTCSSNSECPVGTVCDYYRAETKKRCLAKDFAQPCPGSKCSSNENCQICKTDGTGCETAGLISTSSSSYNCCVGTAIKPKNACISKASTFVPSLGGEFFVVKGKCENGQREIKYCSDAACDQPSGDSEYEPCEEVSKAGSSVDAPTFYVSAGVIALLVIIGFYLLLYKKKSNVKKKEKRH